MGLALCSNAGAAINATKTSDAVTSFKSTVLVNSSEIKADSLIKNDADQRLREALAAVQIGFIPNPLGELVIDRATLQKKLGNLIRDISVPEKITIRRNGSILKGSDVREKIVQFCQQKTDAKLDIDLSRVPTNMVLPGNATSWDVTTASDNTLGMKLFVVTAETDGGPFRQLIQIKVSRSFEAAQLTRLAKPGEVINAGMLKSKKMVLKSDQGTIPLSYEEALGKSLGRFKSAGTMIREIDLAEAVTEPCEMTGVKTIATNKAGPAEKASLMIKPGSSVDFLVNSGNLSLKIPAKAVSGGNPGDEITLINLQNKRRIKGFVTEKGTVEYAKN